MLVLLAFFGITLLSIGIMGDLSDEYSERIQENAALCHP